MEDKNNFNWWASFCGESTAFTETFRVEMAAQLLKNFYLMLGVTTEISFLS